MVLEDGLRKRKEREKTDANIKTSSNVIPLSQVWKPSQRAQTITIWILLVTTTFFSIAVVVEELQASWYRSPVLNAWNSQLHGAASLDMILPAKVNKLTNGPRNIILTWNVTQGVRSPDGLRSNVYLINGQFPGPTVEARSGDMIYLDLINSLDNEDLAMHFGGEPLSSMRAPSRSKAAQNTIVAAQTRQQYGLQVPPENTGTFLYRAKNELQAASGLFGAFVLHGSSSIPSALPELQLSNNHTSHEERVITINEWHSFTADRATSTSKSLLPPSILINGIGNRNCSQIDLDLKLSCIQKTGRSQPNMQFVAGQNYRLRLINAGTTSGVTFTIPGALMTIVELDGEKVVPKKATSIGVLKPGQTIDVMIEWEAGGDDEFLVALEDDHGDGTIMQSFPIRVSGFVSSQVKPPPHRYRDVLRLKPIG